MKKNYLLSVFAIMMAFALSATLVSCGGDSSSDSSAPPVPTPDPTPTPSNVTVSPTAVSLLSDAGSYTQVTVTTTDNWTISGCPEWLHMTASAGSGNSAITLTTKSDNFSDETRTATITVATSTSSVSFTVSQEPSLAKNMKVTLSDMTIMSDGFACDLVFSPGAKGYREAFFTESYVNMNTERDIYNELMTKTEYQNTADWTFSPIVDAGTTMYYCIAAYGNENRQDGSHKYGKMTMQKVTTTARTQYADMYVTSTYNSSRWTATVQKYGTYGTRCKKYYYFAAEGSIASNLNTYYLAAPYAYLAHFFYKPIIKEHPNDYAISDQSFYYSRSENQFFFGVWGIDDTDAFSAEHTKTYQDLSSSSNIPMILEKTVQDPSQWNTPREIPIKKEIKEIYKKVKVGILE